MINNEVCLITNIKLECALFEVHMVITRSQMEQEFSFWHHVYKGALNKKYFDNRIKAVPNSEYALISEMHSTCTHEYGIFIANCKIGGIL